MLSILILQPNDVPLEHLRRILSYRRHSSRSMTARHACNHACNLKFLIQTCKNVESLVQPTLQLRLHRRALQLGEAINLFLPGIGRLCLHLFNECLFLVRTERWILDIALDFQFFRYECLQTIKIASGAVVLSLHVSILEILESRISLHSKLFAQRVSTVGTVDITNEDRRRSGKFRPQLVPRGLDGLAMTTPGRKELDERILSAHFRLKVIKVELHRTSSSESGDNEESTSGDGEDQGRELHRIQ